MARVTKTTHPYNFEVLDHRQFEDLVRQVALRWRAFGRLDPVGRLGSDGGRDAQGTERLKARGTRKAEDRAWLLQMKNYKKIGAQALRDIVAEAVPEPSAAPHGLLVAVAAPATKRSFDAFDDESRKRGVKEPVLWDASALNDQLQDPKNFDLPRFYWGAGPALDGTVLLPRALDGSAGLDVPVIGRDEVLKQLRAHQGDLIIVGPPGSGKTRLAIELEDVRFVRHRADENTVAESFRRHRPLSLVLDDAGLSLSQLEVLLELRRHKYEFRIVTTAWPKDLGDVKRALTGPLVVDLDLLERSVMDQVVQATGVTNVYLRREILDQAEGRPGWAITLAELAKAEIQKTGTVQGLLSGAGLVDQVEPYLSRVGATSAHARGFLSVLSAIGELREDELPALDAHLGIGLLERDALILEAASAGLIEPRSGGFRVVPEPLRFALVADQFYERVGPWRIDPVVARWPDHRREILATVLAAASMGSEAARRDFDRLVPDVAQLETDTLERYAALDPKAALRATQAATAGKVDAYQKQTILNAAARRFLLPEAVRALLDSAIGDERMEHSAPEHPVRLLGEIGTRVGPDGRSAFDARKDLLELATEWLDADYGPERQRVWAKLTPYLLAPTAEGTYTDPGDPMTLHMMAAFETPTNLKRIDTDLWAPIADRLPGLSAQALIPVIRAVEDWIRLGRGIAGSFGTKPSSAQIRIGQQVSRRMLKSLQAACFGKPGAQVVIQDTSRMYRLGLRQKINPEFRLLTLDAWKLPGRGRRGGGLIHGLVERLAECWASERPADLMSRIRGMAEEAQLVERSLHPMIHQVMAALAARTSKGDRLIRAGLKGGLGWQLDALMEASLARPRAPAWLQNALSEDARQTAIRATLRPGAGEAAARWGIGQLGDDDIRLAEMAMWVREDADWVCGELLRHPSDPIRGSIALWFSVNDRERHPHLPDEWYDDWKSAIEVAPAESSRGGDNHRLGVQFEHLIGADPDVVERWLVRHLTTAPKSLLGMLDLPGKVSSRLVKLPRATRDRLMRRFAAETFAASLLAHLLGDDVGWLADLIDQHVIGVDDAIHSLSLGHIRSDEPKIDNLLALAPVLLPRGASPTDLAYTAMFGTHVGPESSHYEKLRQAFASAAQDRDPYVKAVGDAGVEYYARLRDEAKVGERQARVTGRR